MKMVNRLTHCISRMSQANPVTPTTRPIATPLSLRRNFSWTLAGNIVYAASQWGMLVVLARVGTPEMVGQFSLGLAVTAPIILFANLGLRQIQATDARREYAFGEYLGLRIIALTLALVLIAAIALTGYRPEAALVILLMGAAKAFEALSDVIYGLLQQHERMDRIAQSMMIKGPVSLAAMAAGVALTGGVLGGVVGLALVWALLFVLYDLYSARLLTGDARTLWPQWNAQRLRQLGWLALPMGFVAMLISLNANIPRYFVERYLGEAQLGIYAAMAYLIVAGNTVVGALGQSASPRLAAYYAQGDRQAFTRLLLRLLGIGAGLGAAGVLVALLAGKLLLSLLYGPAYAAEAQVFVWIMVAAGVIYVGSFMGYGVTAARIFKLQVALSGISILVAVILSFLLIPQMGVLGTALVVMIGGIADCFLRGAVLLKAVKFEASQQS
jgi:O-antigen/teichoic acid export membrane protein